jgi:hypothetical protein
MPGASVVGPAYGLFPTSGVVYDESPWARHKTAPPQDYRVYRARSIRLWNNAYKSV